MNAPNLFGTSQRFDDPSQRDRPETMSTKSRVRRQTLPMGHRPGTDLANARATTVQ